MTAEADIRLQIRVKNARILRAMKAPHMPHNRQPFENEEAA